MPATPRTAFLLGALLLFAAPWAAADITPDDADRREGEKKLVPNLDRPGAGDDFQDLVEESEANLKEIQKLLDAIEEDLSRQETGAATQGKQKEAVEKMQTLLEKMEQACKKCAAGGSCSQPGKSADQKQESEEERQEGKEPEPSEAKKSEAQEQPSEKEQKEGQVENRRTEEAAQPEAQAGNLRDQLLEMSRRWGVLPPKLREEMLFSTGREAPPEYLEIISRYYKRLTEFYQESPRR